MLDERKNFTPRSAPGFHEFSREVQAKLLDNHSLIFKRTNTPGTELKISSARKTHCARCSSSCLNGYVR